MAVWAKFPPFPLPLQLPRFLVLRRFGRPIPSSAAFVQQHHPTGGSLMRHARIILLLAVLTCLACICACSEAVDPAAATEQVTVLLSSSPSPTPKPPVC